MDSDITRQVNLEPYILEKTKKSAKQKEIEKQKTFSWVLKFWEKQKYPVKKF